MKPNIKPCLIVAELLALFILTPLLLFGMGARLWIFAALWAFAGFAVFILNRKPDFSFQKLWQGRGWPSAAKRRALLRFVFLACVLTFLTYLFLPDKFFRFPLEHPLLWLAVMMFYPLLSVIPQELLFRCFFFMRYGVITGEKFGAVLINGLLFGFSHITLNNWIAPAFSLLVGIILAHSYLQHRSLKWAVVEHSLYGCWVFTIGIGWYFFTGNWRF
ncbi:MAG: CPBP family intramembrane glutamic endopeptidase [Methylomonas sp.]